MRRDEKREEEIDEKDESVREGNNDVPSDAGAGVKEPADVKVKKVIEMEDPEVVRAKFEATKKRMLEQLKGIEPEVKYEPDSQESTVSYNESVRRAAGQKFHGTH